MKASDQSNTEKICNDCALEAGRKMSEESLPTWNMGTCSICSKRRWVTDKTSFTFPDSQIVRTPYES